MPNVNDIPLQGNVDAMGQRIRCFYGRKPPKYAVYRVDRRVMIHFADDGEEEARQRKKLAQLAPIRGEIDGLIDGWRDGTSHRFLGLDNRAKLLSKAIRYDRRVADALVVALEDSIPCAHAILLKVKEDILNERVAWARFEYLVAAFASALLVMFAAWLLSSLYPVIGDTRTEERMATIGWLSLLLLGLAASAIYLGSLKIKRPTLPKANHAETKDQAGTEAKHQTDTEAKDEATDLRVNEDSSGWAMVKGIVSGLLLVALAAIPIFAILIEPSFTYAPVHADYVVAIDLWRAAAAGAVGAFFSISLAIRGRTVLPDLQRTSNLMDAVLRVTIGFIAGAVVMGLIRAGIVDLRFGDAARNVDAVLPVLITGFVAGFSERLVPDLLDKADFKTTDPSAPTPAAARPPIPARDEGGRTGLAAEMPAAPPPVEPDPVPAQAGEDGCAADIDLDDDEIAADADLPAATGGVARPDGGAQ